MAFEKDYSKYLVLKWEDIEKYLTQTDFMETLLALCKYIEHCRGLNGKKDNSYVVVNEDEPYAEQVWELIEEEANDG